MATTKVRYACSIRQKVILILHGYPMTYQHAIRQRDASASSLADLQYANHPTSQWSAQRTCDDHRSPAPRAPPPQQHQRHEQYYTLPARQAQANHNNYSTVSDTSYAGTNGAQARPQRQVSERSIRCKNILEKANTIRAWRASTSIRPMSIRTSSPPQTTAWWVLKRARHYGLILIFNSISLGPILRSRTIPKRQSLEVGVFGKLSPKDQYTTMQIFRSARSSSTKSMMPCKQNVC